MARRATHRGSPGVERRDVDCKRVVREEEELVARSVKVDTEREELNQIT